jgi:hypothetical protein
MILSLFLLAWNGASYVEAQKYISSEIGVTRLSKSYYHSTTLLHPEVALPVISTMDDHQSYSDSLELRGMNARGNTIAVEMAYFALQEEKVAKHLGMEEDETIEYALNVFKVEYSTSNLLAFRDSNWLSTKVTIAGKK